MATNSTQAQAQKALALAERLGRQHARLIAKANGIKKSTSRFSGFAKAFSAGRSFGRPKESLKITSSEGMTSFHFKLTIATKGSAFSRILSGRPLKNTDGPTTTAGDHQSYIERQDAIERDKQPHKDADKTADHAAQYATVLPNEEGYSAAASCYIDRDGAIEDKSSFGNIATTLKERISFWNAVERCARTPKSHTITLEYGYDMPFWKKVFFENGAPKILIDFVIANRNNMSLRGPDLSTKTVVVDDKTAKEIYDYYNKNGSHFNERKKPINFKAGRGGRVQHRLVIDLPADMTAAQRLSIAKRFCAKEFGDKGAPFHCAIHRPGKLNDDRHFHMHITFSDRPAQQIIDPETNRLVWDFEYRGIKKYKNRTTAEAFTQRQAKLECFRKRDWAKTARKHFADIVNEVRNEAGQKPIYDPRKYKAMGIEYEPLPTLTREEFHDVQRGVPNESAAKKIEKRWLRLLYKTVDANNKNEVIPNKKIIDRFNKAIDETAKKTPVSIVMVKAIKGAYLEGIRMENSAKTEKIAAQVAVAKELSVLFPEIGKKTKNVNIDHAVIKKLQESLLIQILKGEQTAQAQQANAITKLFLIEKQLKEHKKNSRHLRGPSMEQISMSLRLNNLMTALKQKKINDEREKIIDEQRRMNEMFAEQTKQFNRDIEQKLKIERERNKAEAKAQMQKEIDAKRKLWAEMDAQPGLDVEAFDEQLRQKSKRQNIIAKSTGSQTPSPTSKIVQSPITTPKQPSPPHKHDAATVQQPSIHKNIHNESDRQSQNKITPPSTLKNAPEKTMSAEDIAILNAIKAAQTTVKPKNIYAEHADQIDKYIKQQEITKQSMPRPPAPEDEQKPAPTPTAPPQPSVPKETTDADQEEKAKIEKARRDRRRAILTRRPPSRGGYER